MNANEILNYSLSVETILNNPYAIAIGIVIAYILGFHFLGRRAAGYIAKELQENNKEHYPNIYTKTEKGINEDEEFIVFMSAVFYPVSVLIIIIFKITSMMMSYVNKSIPDKP